MCAHIRHEQECELAYSALVLLGSMRVPVVLVPSLCAFSLSLVLLRLCVCVCVCVWLRMRGCVALVRTHALWLGGVVEPVPSA
jgi:hypothetical protein